MTKFVVLDAEGEEVEVEADSYHVDGDGFLIFSTVVDAWSPEEWHTVSEEVEDEDEGEDETAEDLVDRLIETFDGDLTVLHALANLRAVLSDDDEDEAEADEDETEADEDEAEADEDETAEDLIDRLEETFEDDDMVLDVLDLLRDAVDAEDR